MLKIQKHGLTFSFVILISIIIFPNLVLAESNFALEEGVWIEYEDWWSEEHIAQWPALGIWYRVDIESVEGNTLTYKWTIRFSGGGEQTDTNEGDIEDGYWEKGIPPDLNVGDSIRGGDIIQGSTERIYAGKKRVVLFLEYETVDSLTNKTEIVKYFYDKETGIVLEYWTPNDGYNLTKTNAWDNTRASSPEPERSGSIPGFNIDSVLIGLALGVIVIWLSRLRVRALPDILFPLSPQ